MSEAIKNHPLHSQSIWKTKNYILYYYIMLISRKENLITDPHLSFAKIIWLFYCVMQHKPLFECLKVRLSFKVNKRFNLRFFTDLVHSTTKSRPRQNDWTLNCHHQRPLQAPAKSQTNLSSKNSQLSRAQAWTVHQQAEPAESAQWLFVELPGVNEIGIF